MSTNLNVSSFTNGSVYTFVNQGMSQFALNLEDNNTVSGRPFHASIPNQQWKAIAMNYSLDSFNLQNIQSKCYLTFYQKNGPLLCQDQLDINGWTLQGTTDVWPVLDYAFYQISAFLQCGDNNTDHCPILVGAGGGPYHQWKVLKVNFNT